MWLVCENIVTLSNSSYCPLLYKCEEDKLIHEIKVKGIQRQDDNKDKINKKSVLIWTYSIQFQKWWNIIE